MADDPSTIAGAIKNGSGATTRILSVRLSGRAQIIGKTRTDARHEELVDAHPATGELLLVEIGYQRVQRRKAAVDRVVPDLGPEDSARRFHLVDDPRQADRQGTGVVHRLMG